MISLIPGSWYPIPILMYHQIAETPPKGAPFRSLYVSPRDFSNQMAILRRLGYQGLSMADLLPYLKGERRGKVFGITFDDGYLNNLLHALPILQENRFTSTCYVVSQLLGQTNIWDKDIGISQVPLMNPDQLAQWLAGGQDVGAHTRHHVRLRTLDASEALNEIQGCKDDLETALGVPVRHFCYPYGDFDDAHVTMTQGAGYLTSTTTQRGRCSPGADLFRLPRITVARRTTRLGLWLRMAMGFRGNR